MLRRLETPKRLGPRIALFFFVWTALGMAETTQIYVSYAYHGDPLPWSRALALGLSLCYTWAILYFFVAKLARRFPIDQPHWRTRVELHLLASMGFAFVKLVMDYPIIKFFYCPTPDLLTFPSFYYMALVGHFHSYVLIYWAMLGVCHTAEYHRKYRDREMRSTQMEARLAYAELQILKTQIQPHFLFNTLHGISSMIHHDVEMADRMLARLGDLLRLSLEHVGEEEVSLAQELESIEAYLEIEQVRFGPRLQIKKDIDPDLLDASVPYFLLQPIVENALQHGLLTHGGSGRIELRGRKSGEMMRLEVEDDGPGLANKNQSDLQPNRMRNGIGLTNTRSRLQKLFGEVHRFDMSQGNLGGVLVTIELPLRG